MLLNDIKTDCLVWTRFLTPFRNDNILLYRELEKKGGEATLLLQLPKPQQPVMSNEVRHQLVGYSTN